MYFFGLVGIDERIEYLQYMMEHREDTYMYSNVGIFITVISIKLNIKYEMQMNVLFAV